MQRYKVVEKSFINHAIREVGEVVEYDGEVAANLQLVEEDKPRKAASKAEEKE
jgi:hypothetical protein